MRTGCPLVTADLGWFAAPADHGEGVAGEDSCGSCLVVAAQLRWWVKPVQGDPGLVGKPPQEARQLAAYDSDHRLGATCRLCHATCRWCGATVG